MKRIAISSTLGDPHHRRTWSAAPSNLSRALSRQGIKTVPIDSSHLSVLDKSLMIGFALAAGLPWNAVSWTAQARRRRGRYVAELAAKNDVDHVLCCGSLDCPVGSSVSYSIWIDNTLNLLCNSTLAPAWNERARANVDELERVVLLGATNVFSFSEHVRADLICHYGVPISRVHAVGCGSGDVVQYTGAKDYQSGYLLFVAKHAFREKGGELVLAAFARIREMRPQTQLVIVAEDRVVERVKLIPGVQAFGWVTQEKITELYHGAAMLVQPMLGDSWGQVYLEAMKAKAIVVALNRGALPEITKHGTLAVLIDEANPTLIADAILDTYQRPAATLESIANAAQSVSLERYNWDAVAKRIADRLLNT